MESKSQNYPADFLDLKRMNRALRHRLRNLCAGVKMTMERISDTVSQTHPQLDGRCKIIITEMNSLQEFTDRMDLLFDALRPPAPVSLFDLVSSLRESFVKKYPLCTLEFKGDELDAVFKNGNHLYSALWELLDNAGDAVGAEFPVLFSWEAKDGVFRFEIKNGGRIIPEGLPMNPPEPFHTPRSRHDGIGLAIVFRICRECGMSLQINSSSDNAMSGASISIPDGEWQNG